MTEIRAIFFDIGDTLLFDEPPLIERFRIATEAIGLSYEPNALTPAFRQAEDYALTQYVLGIPWDDPDMSRKCTQLMLTALNIPELTSEQWSALYCEFGSIRFERVLHPKAISLVQTLRERGFYVGAISDWEDTLPQLLQDLGLAQYLDALAVSAIVGVTKPSPILFADGLRQINTKAEEALHIGDYYELDVAGAQTAGMSALLFDWKSRTPNANCPRVTTFDDLAATVLALPCPAQ